MFLWLGVPQKASKGGDDVRGVWCTVLCMYVCMWGGAIHSHCTQRRRGGRYYGEVVRRSIAGSEFFHCSVGLVYSSSVCMCSVGLVYSSSVCMCAFG
jgi:hypothetical protein